MYLFHVQFFSLLFLSVPNDEEKEEEEEERDEEEEKMLNVCHTEEAEKWNKVWDMEKKKSSRRENEKENERRQRTIWK